MRGKATVVRPFSSQSAGPEARVPRVDDGIAPEGGDVPLLEVDSVWGRGMDASPPTGRGGLEAALEA